MIHLRYLLLLLSLPMVAKAYWESPKSNSFQSDSILDTITTKKIELEDDSTTLPLGLKQQNIDSLLSSWVIRQQTFFESHSDKEVTKEYSDSIYIKRLASLPTIIEMPYNSIVRKYIDLYAIKQKTFVGYLLGLGQYYFPMFEEALDKAGLPLELKYLPIIESALNPTARSHMGATGLWQFMYRTGKVYGLHNNSLIDDRRNPEKATQAAVKCLKDLYEIYHDWNLAIAAYNCGPGNVNKAIRRSGGKRDYWQIYFNLPRETRGYLPGFIAVNYIMTYYWAHGIEPVAADLSYASDTVMVYDRIHFKQISAILNIPIDEIKTLNPQYKKELIPGSEITGYPLRLPIKCGYKFIELKDSIKNYNRKSFIKHRLSVSPYQTDQSGKERDVIYHKVRSGETLSYIAKKYHVYVSQLKRWNHLRSSRINIGKRLIIYRR